MRKLLALLWLLIAAPLFAQSAPLVFSNGRVVPMTAVQSNGNVSLTNIAALRAYSLPLNASATANVSGYSAVTDIGGGQFTYVSSDTTSADNGGTIIVDASSRRWYRVNPTGILTPQMFGAKCDNATDDTTAIQRMAAAANNPTGNHIVFPAGQCLVSGNITLSQPFVLEGSAEGIQSGGAAYASIVMTNATANVLSITTSQAFTIKNIGFRAGITRLAGSDIVVSGDGTNVPASFVIDNVGFNGSFNCINIPYGHQWKIRNSQFQNYGNAGSGDAIYYPSTGHADDGDNEISGNTFISGVTGSGVGQAYAAVYLESTFALFIHDNKIFGAQFGINVTANNGSGNLIVHGNSFEQQGQNNIIISQHVSSGSIGNVLISGNEFSELTTSSPSVNPTAPPIQISQGPTAAYVTNLSITDNVFNNNYTGTQSYIAVGDGTGTIIKGNVFNAYNVSGPGMINTYGNATNAEIEDNVFNNQLTSQHYKNGLNSSTRVRDMNLHCADVSAWANGSQVYVVDGTPGAALACSGTGAWARRTNGVWNAN